MIILTLSLTLPLQFKIRSCILHELTYPTFYILLIEQQGPLIFNRINRTFNLCKNPINVHFEVVRPPKTLLTYPKTLYLNNL